MGGCCSNPKLPDAEQFCKARKPLEPTLFPGMVNQTQTRTYIVQRKFWSWTGNDYTVIDSFNTPQCLMSGTVFTLRNRAAFKDLQGNIVCVVLEKRFSMHAAFFIYGVKPHWEGHKSEEEHEGMPLYLFGKLNKKNCSCRERYTLLLATPPKAGSKEKENYVNLYDIQAPKWWATNMFVTDCANQNSGVALLDAPMFQWDAMKYWAITICVALLDAPMFQWDAMKYWAITVSAGVDPILLFATVMIVDELRDREKKRKEEEARRNARKNN